MLAFDETLAEAYQVWEAGGIRLPSYFFRVEGSYLITVGKIQRAIPTPADGLRILCPGISMPSDNQTSPRTCAKDVKMSAKMMSEKYTGSS